MKPKIAVLMTCHNRVNTTLSCLKALYEQINLSGIDISVFLVDDGSTDGTAENVSEKYPQVNIIKGDGNLFWNRGMHRAFAESLKREFDYYLWLNDDTLLHNNALEVLLKTHLALKHNGFSYNTVIASTKDSATGEFTYGGYRRTGRFNPIGLRLVPAEDKPVSCDTFCGNVVMISKEVVDRVGNIDPIFKHRWGDVDYGLRAKSLGCRAWIAPGYLAECSANPNADKWRNRKLSVKERIKEIQGIKGLAKEDWRIYVHRHGGVLWPLMWARPYLRLFFDVVNPFR